MRVDLPGERTRKYFRGGLKACVKLIHVKFSPVLDELGTVFEPEEVTQ